MRAKVVSTLLHELAVEFRKVLKQAENSKHDFQNVSLYCQDCSPILISWLL